MAATQEKPTRDIGKDVDPTAPAGTENSLGAESVRDGRPSTDDSTVEAMDEAGPGITAPVATDKTGTGHQSPLPKLPTAL